MTKHHCHPVMPDMANLAERLRTPRSQHKVNPARFAELPCVSPRVHNRWETGDVVPHCDAVIKIAKTLDLRLDELAGRGRRPNKAHTSSQERTP